MNILQKIIADKRREITLRRERVSLREMEKRATETPAPADFLAALKSVPIGLIAEVKRRSPSAGIIRTPFDPAKIARSYERGGAQALSVLMDGPYFGGGETDFKAVRNAVKLPMLYKEFVIDPWQVAHARVIGASALLLIVAALPRKTLADLYKLVVATGLTPLVEVHDQRELSVAKSLGAICIGVNNRNLKTFETKLETTFRLASQMPRGGCLVSESGIRTAENVVRLKEAGAQAVLVGEHLLRKRVLARAVKTLMGEAWAVS
ncbi:MAG: indole-3-glycerol phosphate synthase TrpC [Kiritimatiellae bacterium]|nr:indole-3-glycerol phosphate synthase TrpC [Kiritimatiellia bacterium]